MEQRMRMVNQPSTSVAVTAGRRSLPPSSRANITGGLAGLVFAKPAAKHIIETEDRKSRAVGMPPPSSHPTPETLIWSWAVSLSDVPVSACTIGHHTFTKPTSNCILRALTGVSCGSLS